MDILFAPTAAEMYPPGFDTWVDPGALGAILEGAVRPGHFRAVATVCVKLFHLVTPDRAYFGRKDAQQVAVIRTVLRDLDMAWAGLRVLPTVRDPDGLALSSRNGPARPRGARAGPRAAARTPAGSGERATIRRTRRNLAGRRRLRRTTSRWLDFDGRHLWPPPSGWGPPG